MRIKKTISIPLPKAPMCFSFIKRITDFSGFLSISEEVLETMYITSMCQCGDNDCGTFTLKRNEEWGGELPDSYIIDTSKGVVIIHLLKNGYMEIEAIMYDHFPYKPELKRVLQGNFKAPSKKECAQLDAYFSDIAPGDMKTIVVDN